MVSFIGDFISTFHRKHWLDSNDCELAQVCLTAKVSSKRRGVAPECASSTSAQADSSGSLISGANNVPAEAEGSAVARTSVEVTRQSSAVIRGLDDRSVESDRTFRAETAAVRDTVSGDAVRRDEVSSDAVSRDEVSKDAVGGDGVSRDEVSRDAVSRDEVSRDEVSRDTVSRDAVSRDAVSREEVSGDKVSRDEVSRDEVSRDAVSGDGVSREDLDEDFLQLPELRPPNIMPRGNVGTSTQESNPSRAAFLFCQTQRYKEPELNSTGTNIFFYQCPE
jgi:pentapeptide MXKDX repeat protein